MDSAFATQSALPGRWPGTNPASRQACQPGRLGLGRARPDRPDPGRHNRDRQKGRAAIVSQPPARVVSIAAASLALLSACGSSNPPPSVPCPTVLLLKGAERTAEYRPGPDTRPADLRYLAVLSDLVSACRYDEAGAEVGLRFNLIAEQGPAYEGGPLQLTYFIATLAPDQEVWSKDLLDSEVMFPEGNRIAGNSEQMTVRLPGVEPAAGSGYEVYVGFQLDDAEMRRRLEPETF